MEIELSESDQKRFEAKVDRSGGPDACHLWTGYRDRQGYGRFWVGDRIEKAHRVAWILAGNEISDEKPCVLHNCPGGDLPMCCNARHLWNGTNADNCRDMAKKGRGRMSKRGLPFGAHQSGSGFAARVRINGKKTYLGTYDSAEEASGVATAAKERHLAGHT